MQNENKQEEKLKDLGKIKKQIIYKILTTLIRLTLFIAAYYFRQINFQASTISIFSFSSFFIVSQIIYWYYHYKNDTNKQYNKFFIIVLHTCCFLNFLGMGFTFKYTDINPTEHYFLMEVSLLFNYGISFIYINGVYFSDVPQNNIQFILLHQPLQNSIWYICLGLYLGSLFDSFAFYKQSAWIFFSFNILLILYLISKFLQSKNFKSYLGALILE